MIHESVLRAALPLLLLAACAGGRPRPPARLAPVDSLVATVPPEVGMNPGLPARLDSIVTAAIADGASPGAALAVGRHGRAIVLRGYGNTDWEAGRVTPALLPVTDSTLYDLASLTKVVATTTAAMILEEQGRLDLDRPVRLYLAEFDDPAKADITPRLLLVHRGGMEAFAPLFRTERGRAQYLHAINARPLKHLPGTVTEYSDWDFILMQLIIERITGEPLDRFVDEHVFRPLGMRDTGFRPAPAERGRVAPTEVEDWRCGSGPCPPGRHGGKVWGQVHDENAWAIGGVSGHAGLFSSARDLAVFAQMLLNGGSYGGVRILRPETVARWTARQAVGSSRALGWDTPSEHSSAGRYFSPRAFGHTGFTGTSIWVDPQKDLFVVLLTNRVDPTRENTRVGPLRRAVADAVQEAVLDVPLIDWEARQ